MIRLHPLFAIFFLAATPAFAQPERNAPADTTLPPALLGQFRADAAATREEADFLDLDSVPVPVTVRERRDLNGDGQEEVVLSGLGRYCGASGNCPLWIYQAGPGGAWKRIHAGAGLGVEVRRTKTNGFADLITPEHFSAYETYRSGYAHDGNRYVWTGTTFHAGEDGKEREIFQVFSPVPATRAEGGTLPRSVVLRRIGVDSARGIVLSAEYLACGSAPSTAACGTGRILLRTPGMQPGACHTLFIAGFDDEFKQIGDPLCAAMSDGVMALRPSLAQWDALYGARTTELRSDGGIIRITGYPRDAVAAFVAGIHTVEGRPLPEPEW